MNNSIHIVLLFQDGSLTVMPASQDVTCRDAASPCTVLSITLVQGRHIVILRENPSCSKDSPFTAHGSCARISHFCILSHNSFWKLGDFLVVKYTNVTDGEKTL